jgi:hypothetical protein
VHFVTAPGSAASRGHRARSKVYVTPSGRLVVTRDKAKSISVVTRDNAKSISSMRVIFITFSVTAAVCGAVRLQ